MPTKSLFVLILIATVAVWAADSVVPLNVKEGLWEVTSTHSMTGLPGAPNIPADKLAQMPPEQRARIEAMINGTPTTQVTKDCVTKEKLEKQLAFNQNANKECTRTVVSSTASKLEMKIHCTGQGKDHMSTDGTFVLEATSSESAKGSMHTVTAGNGHNMNMDFTFSTKYLGPACGDVK